MLREETCDVVIVLRKTTSPMVRHYFYRSANYCLLFLRSSLLATTNHPSVPPWISCDPRPPPPFFPAITSDWPLIVIHFTFSVTVLLYLSNRICHLLLRVFTDLSATYGTTDFVTAACLQEPSSFRTNLFRKKKGKKKEKMMYFKAV